MSTNELTELLLEARRGDQSAIDRLLPVVYAELRKLAARQLRRERHGHTLQPTALVKAQSDADTDLLALHEALEQLEKKDERLAKIVELRYFGGLSIEETASVLDIGTATVERDWRTAKAWLHRALASTAP